MKKIISIATIVGILLTSFATVNASVVTFEDEGDTVIESSSIPSKAEVLARDVKFSINAVKITEQSTVRDLSNRTFGNNNKISERDVYNVTVTFSDLGELANGYGSENETDYIGLGGWQIDLPTTAILDSYYKNSVYDADFTIAAGQNSAYPTLFTTNGGVGSGSNPYPRSIEGAYAHIANAEITYSFLVSVKKDSVVNITGISPSVTYVLTGPDAFEKPLATASLVLGEVEVEEPGIAPAAEVEAEAIGTVEGYYDIGGNAVTSFSENYGITKFSTALDTTNKKYYLYITDTNNESNMELAEGVPTDESAAAPFLIDFDAEKIETSGTVQFFALVHSTTHVIKSIRLLEVAK